MKARLADRARWARALGVVRTLAFDEEAYLRAHPDVAAAVAAGEFQSGLHHYARHGHREGRRLTSHELAAPLLRLLRGADAGKLRPRPDDGASVDPTAAYQRWLREHEAPSDDALDRSLSTEIAGLRVRPTISILLPVHDPDLAHLEACLESVFAQSYPRWELCVADDASRSTAVRERLRAAAASDPRVQLVERAENGHICKASNGALALASGEWVALLDHDDVLPRHALLHMVRALAQHPEAALLYGDEDKLDAQGGRTDPHFKPSWDPDRLLEQHYVGHLVVARRAQVLAVGGFREGYEGSQDHDLVLRLTESLPPASIVHVPHVTYHWRVSETSTAASPDAKRYTHDAGLRAVRDALARRQVAATVDGRVLRNCYRVRRALPPVPPRVSVVIPTRDRVDLLRTCLGTLLEKTDYPDLEILVVDNGSTDPGALAYLRTLTLDPRVRVLRRPGPFNFSALNNSAVEEATGELVCLLNNDIEVVEPGWLRAMVAHALRPEVGCVGATLLYPNGQLQHAGVMLGIGGVAGHGHKGFAGDHPGYFSQLVLTRRVSAVTAACLVMRRELYQRVGGLDAEHLAVAFNDVDLCLRVRDAGHTNLVTPDARLVHHESASRGADTDPGKRERFQSEVRVMQARWGAALHSDPYYSPHLSLTREDFSCVDHAEPGSGNPGSGTPRGREGLIS